MNEVRKTQVISCLAHILWHYRTLWLPLGKNQTISCCLLLLWSHVWTRTMNEGPTKTQEFMSAQSWAFYNLWFSWQMPLYLEAFSTKITWEANLLRINLDITKQFCKETQNRKRFRMKRKLLSGMPWMLYWPCQDVIGQKQLDLWQLPQFVLDWRFLVRYAIGR